MCCVSSRHSDIFSSSKYSLVFVSILKYSKVIKRTMFYSVLESLQISTARSFEYLRLTSLGVIGALVKTDENDVITFLLSTEIVPLCLSIMDSGSELSKTVATFILQKILVDNAGLEYICAVIIIFERIFFKCLF